MHIYENLPKDGLFKIIAYGMTVEAEGGYSVNDPFIIGNSLTLDDVKECVAGRLEVINASYDQEFEVKDIEEQDTWQDNVWELVIDWFPVARIELETD